jgi:hypothetical protein
MFRRLGVWEIEYCRAMTRLVCAEAAVRVGQRSVVENSIHERRQLKGQIP